jgi:thioredoxin-like negative regulator of GroEL
VNLTLPAELSDDRLLTEIGFLASAVGNIPGAEAIFAALSLLQPHKPAPYAGLAVAYLNRQRANDAVAVLDKGVLAVDLEDAAELLAVRALALQLAGRAAESQRALRDNPQTALSRAMLGIAETTHPHQET